jgi:hypothetical protein
MLWCSLNCCEEDIDWVLQPIRGKGLGVVAKRFIPMMSRILVDPVRDVTFPGVLDLQPINGTLLDKERLNSFRSSDESMLFIRVARMNHDCNANASQAFDEDSRVMLVVANRDIHPGEEICINYTNLNGKSGYCSPDEARLILRDKWGIVCADTCKCFDIEYSKMLTRCRDLDHELNRMIYAGNPAGGLLKVDELLGLLDIVNATWTWKRRANWKGFKIAIMRPDTLKLASIYGRRAVCIYSAISHPASDKAKVFEQAVEDPSSHKHFLPKVTRQSA